MGKTIELFMWGYQEHFRIELMLSAKKAFERLGCPLEPEVILVGIKAPEATEGHQVCVEPENGRWDPELFFSCYQRAEEIYKNHPGHNIMYGDAPSMEDKPENIRKDSVWESVKEAMDRWDTQHDTKSFYGRPTRVSHHYVVPILQVPEEDFDLIPALSKPIRWDDFKPSYKGLHYSLIDSILREATEGLVSKDPGRLIEPTLPDSTTMLRQSATNFCMAIALAMEDMPILHVFQNLNDISSLSYEGASASGTLVFLKKPELIPNVKIRLKQPVPLSEHKLVRKLVEMSDDNLACIYTAGIGITGLGEIDSLNDLEFRVAFSGHYKWQLYHSGTHLMSSSYGDPFMPNVRLGKAQVTSLTKHLFGEMEANSIESLWKVVDAAIEQKHGTLIVVAEDAETEATRLRQQCLQIESTNLDTQLTGSLTSIDGAILLDPKGTCHAIGVILDGLACEKGDISRGARFNSAIRYIESRKPATLCIVVSEDGDVNLLPDIQP